MSGGENSDSAETVKIFQVPSTEWIYSKPSYNTIISEGSLM